MLFCFASGIFFTPVSMLTSLGVITDKVSFGTGGTAIISLLTASGRRWLISTSSWFGITAFAIIFPLSFNVIVSSKSAGWAAVTCGLCFGLVLKMFLFNLLIAKSFTSFSSAIFFPNGAFAASGLLVFTVKAFCLVLVLFTGCSFVLRSAFEVAELVGLVILLFVLSATTGCFELPGAFLLLLPFATGPLFSARLLSLKLFAGWLNKIKMAELPNTNNSKKMAIIRRPLFFFVSVPATFCHTPSEGTSLSSSIFCCTCFSKLFSRILLLF